MGMFARGVVCWWRTVIHLDVMVRQFESLKWKDHVTIAQGKQGQKAATSFCFFIFHQSILPKVAKVAFGGRKMLFR